MAPVWFKPKRYGYGATPIAWQGWALVLAFAAAVFGLVWGLIGFDQANQPGGSTYLLFFVCVAILIAALWIISKRTTDGEWRWRWGQDN
jgi:hypothetical protein